MQKFISFLLFFLFFVACARAAPPVPAGSGAGNASPVTRDILVLGRVSDDPRRDIKALQALLDYVIPRLRPVGIREGRVLMARDARQMQSYLRRQQVDWVSDTAAMAVSYKRHAGAQWLLLSEREGGLREHTVFFSRRGSGIRSLLALRGQRLVLQGLASNGGFAVPLAELLYAGLELDLLRSVQDRPSPGRVGYMAAQSEGNIATWVHRQLVEAGAFSNLHWEALGREQPALRDELEVFHQTLPVPRGVEVVAPGLDPRVRERLREVLLEAGSDPAARAALARFFDTRSFVPFDSQAMRELEILEEDMNLIERRQE